MAKLIPPMPAHTTRNSDQEHQLGWKDRDADGVAEIKEQTGNGRTKLTTAGSHSGKSLVSRHCAAAYEIPEQASAELGEASTLGHTRGHWSVFRKAIG